MEAILQVYSKHMLQYMEGSEYVILVTIHLPRDLFTIPRVSNSPCPKIHCGYDQMLGQYPLLLAFTALFLKLTQTF